MRRCWACELVIVSSERGMPLSTSESVACTSVTARTSSSEPRDAGQGHVDARVDGAVQRVVGRVVRARLVDQLGQPLALLGRRALGGELGRAGLQHAPEAQGVGQPVAELAQHVVRVARLELRQHRRHERAAAAAAARLQVAGLGQHPQRLAHRRARQREQLCEVALRGQALAGAQQADLDRAADALDGLLERVGRPDRREDRVLVGAQPLQPLVPPWRERYSVSPTSPGHTSRAEPDRSEESPPMSTAISTDLSRQILQAVEGGATSEDVAAIPVPEAYRAVALHADDAERVAAMPKAEKRPSLAMHVEDVPTPELAPDEVLIAVMASSINYNTVWSAIFEPVPTFAFLRRYAKVRGELGQAARPAVPRGRLGRLRDRAAHRLQTSPSWKPGDRVLVHPNDVALEEPQGHDDAILDPDQRVWGFESNYGGLGELCVAKGYQLMPKPEHLTWEEAACMPLVNCTAYRMLVSPNGAQMRQGDVVLIWGAAGGLGGFALQYVLNGGGYPVCVVSSPEKAEKCRAAGAEWVIDRAAEGFRFWGEDGRQDAKEQLRLGKTIRGLTGGRDPDIVFEHPGRDTFGASVFVTRRGGKIVTCASTTGFLHEFDNRYLWMFTKTIVGSHLANYAEGWAANELCRAGRTHPILSKTYPMDEAGQAADDVHGNTHLGKVGVLCIAPEEGQGVLDGELRERLLPAITRYRG